MHSHQGLLAQHSTQLVNDLQKKLSLGLNADLTESDQFSEFVKAGQTTNIYQKIDWGKNILQIRFNLIVKYHGMLLEDGSGEKIQTNGFPNFSMQ